jgi:hypothetical protein
MSNKKYSSLIPNPSPTGEGSTEEKIKKSVFASPSPLGEGRGEAIHKSFSQIPPSEDCGG